MRVDAAGTSLDGQRPSAETALHLAIYTMYPDIGAVLHTHSPAAVALSRAFPARTSWTFAGHEMLKALPGVTTHEAQVMLPIVDNSQDMKVIWHAVSPTLGALPAYLIRNHGLYGWGANMAEAERIIEAVEWLIMAELAEAQFRRIA